MSARDVAFALMALEEILHHLRLPCDNRDDGVLEHIAVTVLEYKEGK